MQYISKVLRDIKRFRVEKSFQSKRRNADCWLFGEWFGERCDDNSFFLANFVAENHPELEVYWVARQNTDVSGLAAGITVVGYNSREALDVFRRAGAVVMNQGFIDFSSAGYNYFRGAVTVNLWHGVAWKKIGHDKVKRRGMIHNIHVKVFDYFEKTEKYLSLSPRYTSVLRTAFHARDQEVITSGYPRNTLFYSEQWLSMNRKKMLGKYRDKYKMNISDDTTVIVYMPTFRDIAGDLRSLEHLVDDTDFHEWMETNDVMIVQKAHFVSQKRQEFSERSVYSRIITDNDIASYEALGAADILITDYSSCFFDYLILDRPIIHYIYDYTAYKTKDRGLYYEKDDVICGRAAFDEYELKDAIRAYTLDPRSDAGLRRLRKKQYIAFESSESCAAIFANIDRAVRERFEQN